MALKFKLSLVNIVSMVSVRKFENFPSEFYVKPEYNFS